MPDHENINVMKNKIYYLNTCSTCQRILGELEGALAGVTLQNIKEEHISAAELDYIAEQIGGYEAAFNKRAMKYRAQGLNNETLTEADFKKHILAEYTFLKRPIAVIDGEVFAGNAKKTVEALKSKLNA